jgi:SAM-dependent methyltransferase
MRLPAAYDAYADWYEDYISASPSGGYYDRINQLTRDLLGAGTGRCLDLCCGTGARAAVVRDLGWSPLGADLSSGQLHHAAGRLPATLADATALPFPGASFDAAICVLAHTDMPDYAAALGEAARVLRPGGRFVHIGVHPCFTGAFADRSDPARITIDTRYADRSRSFDAWSPAGVRARVGAWHVPLGALLNAIIGAGLRITSTAEDGQDVPDVFAVVAVKTPG